jgi:hypothetical protein
MVAQLVIDSCPYARHDGYIAVQFALFFRKGNGSTWADTVIFYRDSPHLVIDKVVEQWLEYIVSFKIVLTLEAVRKDLGSYFYRGLVHIPGISLHT